MLSDPLSTYEHVKAFVPAFQVRTVDQEHRDTASAQPK